MPWGTGIPGAPDALGPPDTLGPPDALGVPDALEALDALEHSKEIDWWNDAALGHICPCYFLKVATQTRSFYDDSLPTHQKSNV